MKNFLFYLILGISVVLVCIAFDYADAVRGYNATGGEVFTIALPLGIVWNKISAMGQKINRLKEENKALRNYMK